MADPRFSGSGVALITPFDDRGVNESVLRQLVGFHVDSGTDALIICGSTGEAATMSVEEQREAIRIAARESAGRIPIIAGCGGSDTAQVAKLGKNAREAGADAILVSGPPYNKPTQKGLLAHFRAVMDAADLPLVVYNVPGRSAVNILPQTIADLARDERVIGVKEASGDIVQISELARLLMDTKVILWSGNDDHIVPVMSLGGKGIISVLGNIAPAEVSRLAHRYLEGDVAGACQMQLRYLPLIRALFAEPNPIPVKTAVEWLGFHTGPLRLPLTPAEPAAREKLIAAMKDAGLAPLVR